MVGANYVVTVYLFEKFPVVIELKSLSIFEACKYVPPQL